MVLQRLDVPELPDLENLFLPRANGKFRGPHPCHQLVGRRVPHEHTHVLSGKLEAAEALASLDDHRVNLAVVSLERRSDRRDHSGKSVVADPLEADVAVEAQPGRADLFDALDLAAVPDLSDKDLDEVPGLFDFDFVW